MFKYGKKAGYMGIALLVLAVIPLVVAACVIPNIGPEVATKFNAAGEVTRWGKSYELLALPVLAAGIVGLVCVLWNRGRKRYESAN